MKRHANTLIRAGLELSPEAAPRPGDPMTLARTSSLRLLICDVFGHRLPRRHRPFFLTERYQQCERCNAQVPLKRRQPN